MMPSLVENSPCTVGECFTVGVPFLTTDVGGIAELFADRRSDHVVPADSASLSEAILRVITDGMGPALSQLMPVAIMRSWEQFHRSVSERGDFYLSTGVLHPQPLVSCASYILNGRFF